MDKNLVRLILALTFAVALGGCAAPRLPMTEEQINRIQTGNLESDEGIVLVKLNYRTPSIGGGVLNFHYDGKDEIKEGIFVRGLADGFPMFSIPTSLSGKPLMFRVKAGRLSFTQFNRGMAVGDLRKQLSAYVKPRTITYIGDINLSVESGLRFSYVVSEDTNTISALEDQYKTMFSRYPKQIYILKSDL